jgi:Tfp pilus assembly protein PilF
VLYRRALSASEGGQAIGGVLCNYGLLLEVRTMFHSLLCGLRRTEGGPCYLLVVDQTMCRQADVGSACICTSQEWKRDYDGAEELYKRALKIDPADTFALSNYASMLAGKIHLPVFLLLRSEFDGVISRFLFLLLASCRCI